MKRFFGRAVPLAALLVALGAGAARADSCWDHNGSLMRLQAQGNQRWFTYEDPKPSLRNAGVRRGTLLFNGTKRGDWYEGLARVFSRHCPGNPLEYWVEGPVHANPLRVVVRGTRESQRQCRPTGQMRTDELVFTYRYNC